MLKEKSLLRAILCSYLMKSCGTIKDEGSLTSKSKPDILAAIKTLEFREETAMLVEISLYEMYQDRDETIQSFSAHVRAHTLVWNYLITCPNRYIDDNYINQILTDMNTRGYAQSNHCKLQHHGYAENKIDK